MARKQSGKKTGLMPEQYFLVKITLMRSKPKSWRNMCIPADLDVQSFMEIINRLFGWGFAHLYEFCGIDELLSYLERSSASEVSVYELFNCLGLKVRYVYDFGDYHEHLVELKDARFTPESGNYPIYCIKSKGGHGIEDGDCVDWDEDDYDKIFDEETGFTDDYDLFMEVMEKAALRVTTDTVNSDISYFAYSLYPRKLECGDPCVVPNKAELAAQKKAQKEAERAQKAKEKAELKAKEKAEKAALKANTSVKKKTSSSKKAKENS